MNIKDFFRRYKNNEKKGFTVIEVLAVVAILAITSTAVVSVFMAVHKSVKETGTITTEQFHITQVERFIRNEFQVASHVDVFDLDTTTYTPNFTAVGYTPVQDDECMVFDQANKCVYFKKYNETTSTYVVALTLTNVEEVHLTICPYDYAAVTGGASSASVDGMKLKLIYEIVATDYTYSGGIILGNTAAGVDDNMAQYAGTTPQYTAKLLWNQDTTNLSNNKCISFHSEKTAIVSSTATSSTP